MTEQTLEPSLRRESDPIEIVVEGAGSVVVKNYAPALSAVMNKLPEGKLKVTFVDTSEDKSPEDIALMSERRGLIERAMAQHVQHVQFLDKATNDVQYQLLNPDYVIVATPDSTHVNVAEQWLRRPASDWQKQGEIFIEKPLDSNLDSAWRLFRRYSRISNRLHAFDHYRARLLLTPPWLNVVIPFLGNGLRQYTFYFTENLSGDDPTINPAGDGAIEENEKRTKALENGVVLDQMPHVIAVLAYFSPLNPLWVTLVRAGQYSGVGGNATKRTDIVGETFAEVQWVCPDHSGNWIDCTAYVGKGIRGVRSLALGPLSVTYESSVKLLDLVGINGNKVRFDMRSRMPGSTAPSSPLGEESRAYLIDNQDYLQHDFSLNTQPYEIFVQKILDGTHAKDRLTFPIEVGVATLEILAKMKVRIPERNALGVYPSGMRDGSQASQFLDKIRDQYLSEPVWKSTAIFP